MTYNPAPDPGAAVAIIQYVLLVAALIHLAEAVYNRSVYSDAGYLSWRVAAAWSGLSPEGRLFRVCRWAGPSQRFLMAPAGQCLFLLALAFGFLERFNALLIAAVFLLQLVVNLRLRPVVNAPLQMRLMLYAGLFFYHASDDPATRKWALVFICFQSLASYFTSGILKTGSADWRNGSALRHSLSSLTHGHNLNLAKFLRGRPQWCIALAWSVLLFECILPFAFLLGPAGAWLFIGCGICFHLLIALIMGFHDFLFVFLAPYPALLYLASTA